MDTKYVLYFHQNYFTLQRAGKIRCKMLLVQTFAYQLSMFDVKT
jgi:hypothetical protein